MIAPNPMSNATTAKQPTVRFVGPGWSPSAAVDVTDPDCYGQDRDQSL
jgi:hypothetical protein